MRERAELGKMQKRIGLLTGIVVALFCAGLAGQTKPFRYSHVTLVRVVDGDTVRLDVEVHPDLWFHNQSARLLFVDAPELNTAEGKYVRQKLQDFLAQKSLAIDMEKRDAFGRWLVELWANGESASSWLLNSCKLADGVTPCAKLF